MKTPYKTRIAILGILLIGAALSLGTFVMPALADPAPAYQSAQGQSRPQGGGGRPPRAAIEACADKAANDACSVTLDDRQMPGTCRSPDAQRPLACIPADAERG
ncbi:hypothetical protein [Pseudooceanicola aestuarii]|uniref:hypothetical protein n=1 Tax=Pseudooceanicola aestuarii TaxID=2697319 RepID=UPI0019540A97|nr:hypothetical protein [Pseudooceanicola aestuarii]